TAQVHAFIQALSHRHGVLGVEAQADARLLLQGAGRERRRSLLGPVLLFDLGDDVRRRIELLGDGAGGVGVGGRELLPRPLGQFGQERSRRHLRQQRRRRLGVRVFLRRRRFRAASSDRGLFPFLLWAPLRHPERL